MGACFAASALLLPVAGLPQPATPSVQDEADGDELIATVLANGVRRGDITVLRRRDGDFWIPEDQLPALKIEPLPQARRQLGARTWYSARSLGAQRVEFDEATLALSIEFDARSLRPTVLEVFRRAPPRAEERPGDVAKQGASLVLSYHLSLAKAFDASQPARVLLENDLNVRIGPVLLRQETRLDTSARRRFVRGISQLIVDDVPRARRWIAGDVLSSAGAFGTIITGGGLLLSKLYDLAPDLQKFPAATLQASAVLPSQVEVAVDGKPVYRTEVGPGPITLTNLALTGGRQSVTVTVTDATGRRQVVEQPYYFTDGVLAAGLHEYSYFVGKRSDLGAAGFSKYREFAWQGYHRYGVSDDLTVSGGGEGNPDFANGGAGITLRNDRFGLLALEVLGSADRRRHTVARGWSARYTYVDPRKSFMIGRRAFADGFRSFDPTSTLSLMRAETRISAASMIGPVSLSADLLRSELSNQRRDTLSLRVGTRITRAVTLTAEYQRRRVNQRMEWLGGVFVRAELDGQRWVNSHLWASESARGYDVEAGQPLPANEGIGYRVGTSSINRGTETTYGYGGLDWNLRYATVDAFLSAPVRGSAPSYGQVGISGAFAALNGYWGMTRRIGDSFAVASLGVPQPGVEILLNNQVQGRTDAQGRLFIPQVSSLGRQDVSVNDKQLDLKYTIGLKQRSITPAYRSGSMVDFGARQLRAVAGTAWVVHAGARSRVERRAWTLSSGDVQLAVQTGGDGGFYLEDVVPGTYRGILRDDKGSWSCRVTIPDFDEPVLELVEGIICE